jgi:hypothetical protein
MGKFQTSTYGIIILGNDPTSVMNFHTSGNCWRDVIIVTWKEDSKVLLLYIRKAVFKQLLSSSVKKIFIDFIKR